MSKPRWSIEQKMHHVTAWRTSGLTREQYCDLYDIPFKSLQQWSQDVAKAEQTRRKSSLSGFKQANDIVGNQCCKKGSDHRFDIQTDPLLARDKEAMGIIAATRSLPPILWGAGNPGGFLVAG